MKTVLTIERKGKMKKAVSLLAAIMLLCVFSSCGEPDDSINITENMYVTYINEIYTNTDDYVGKNITIEGMFTSEYYKPTDTTYYYVYRQGPGCCGNDGSMCGFEFTWDGVGSLSDNDWIKVTGELHTYEENGATYLTLSASDVSVLDERGAEIVYR